MKVTFIGHAALLIEAGRLRILSDPWWQGPCFGRQWWLYPPAAIAAVDAAPVDYIYISHGHNDHFHRGTLRRFAKSTRILVSQALDLAPAIRSMGFEVIEIARDDVRDLGGGVQCRIIPTHGGDTLMTLTDGDEVCINANDALHAAPSDVQDRIVAELHRLHPKIDYLFCGYGIASHFPNCYVIPGKDNERTARDRQIYFNRAWARVVALIKPRFAFPFAADVIFLEPELFWANEVIHNFERPTDTFMATAGNTPTEAIDIAPGFSIAGGRIVADHRFKPVRGEEIRRHYAAALARHADRIAHETNDADALKADLDRNIARCLPYLAEYAGSYRFLLALKERSWALEIVKKGKTVSTRIVDARTANHGAYDITMTSSYAYLRRSLATRYGHETLFVGSGCLFEYADRARIGENLHRELMVLVSRHDAAPNSRFGDQPKWLFQTKRLAKRMLGRSEPDLYDLRRWTRFR